MDHGAWIAVAAAWIGTLLIVLPMKLRRRRPDVSEVEAQLQHTARDYARERAQWRDTLDKQQLDHRHQMDAIRASVVEYQLNHPNAAPELKRLLDDVVSKTRLRGERA